MSLDNDEKQIPQNFLFFSWRLLMAFFPSSAFVFKDSLRQKAEMSWKHFARTTIIFNFNWVCRSLVCENEFRDKLSLFPALVWNCWCSSAIGVGGAHASLVKEKLLMCIFSPSSFLGAHFSAPVCKFGLSKCWKLLNLIEIVAKTIRAVFFASQVFIPIRLSSLVRNRLVLSGFFHDWGKNRNSRILQQTRKLLRLLHRRRLTNEF